MNTIGSISNFLGGDMVIVLLIVLILFGAKKLPELARGAGQAIREFNKAKDEFEREITKPVDEVKVQQAQGSLPQAAPIAAAPIAAAPAPVSEPQVPQTAPATQSAPGASAPLA